MPSCRKKPRQKNIRLSDEVAFFIAKHLRSNVRELEGALKKVLAYASFHGRPIALDLAKEALKDLINSVRNIGIDYIQKTVADYYKIKVGEIFSKKRTRAIARPRADCHVAVTGSRLRTVFLKLAMPLAVVTTQPSFTPLKPSIRCAPKTTNSIMICTCLLQVLKG